MDVNNKKNYPNNAYYFPQVPDVIRAMKEALELNVKASEERKEDAPESKKDKSATPVEVKPKKTKDAKKDSESSATYSGKV